MSLSFRDELSYGSANYVEVVHRAEAQEEESVEKPAEVAGAPSPPPPPLPLPLLRHPLQ